MEYIAKQITHPLRPSRFSLSVRSTICSCFIKCHQIMGGKELRLHLKIPLSRHPFFFFLLFVSFLFFFLLFLLAGAVLAAVQSDGPLDTVLIHGELLTTSS